MCLEFGPEKEIKERKERERQRDGSLPFPAIFEGSVEEEEEEREVR